MTTLNDFDYLVIGLFRASVAEMQTAVKDILQEKFPPGRFQVCDRELDIAWVYERRPPRGGAHPKRAVLFEPVDSPNTTALIANLEDGWLTMCIALAGRINGEHLLVRTCMDENYPLSDFEVWVDGTSVRYVGALREEPSWEFYARGEPRDFEEPSNYKKRRIRDRLNSEILLSYLKQIGWDLRSANFWQSKKNGIYLCECVGSA